MTTFIYFESLSKCLGGSVIKPWEPIPEKRMYTITFLDYLFLITIKKLPKSKPLPKCLV